MFLRFHVINSDFFEKHFHRNIPKCGRGTFPSSAGTAIRFQNPCHSSVDRIGFVDHSLLGGSGFFCGCFGKLRIEIICRRASCLVECGKSAIASSCLVGGNRDFRLPVRSRSAYQIPIQGKSDRVWIQMERRFQELGNLSGNAGHHDSACHLFFVDNKFPVALSFLQNRKKGKSLAGFLDLGNHVLPAIHRTRILFPWIHDTRFAEAFRLLQHLHHDDSLLHDSFRKTDAGNRWSDYRRIDSWNVEHEKPIHSARRVDPLQHCHLNGHVCAVEKRIFLK